MLGIATGRSCSRSRDFKRRIEETLDLARKHRKPYLHIHAGQADAADRLRMFLAENVIQTLNVAGPRESKEPSVAQFVVEMLDCVFGTSDRPRIETLEDTRCRPPQKRNFGEKRT